MRAPRLVAVFVALLLAVPAAAAAQDATPAGTTTGADDALTEARDRVHMLLLRPDVRRVARDQGIDLRPVHDRVETLDAATLARIAPYADALDGEAATTEAITLTTTTIILGLLVIILLVLIL